MSELTKKKIIMIIIFVIGLILALLGFIDVVSCEDTLDLISFLPDWLGLTFFLSGMVTIGLGIYLYWLILKDKK